MFRYLCPAAISKTHSCPHFLMKPHFCAQFIPHLHICLEEGEFLRCLVKGVCVIISHFDGKMRAD